MIAAPGIRALSFLLLAPLFAASCATASKKPAETQALGDGITIFVDSSVISKTAMARDEFETVLNKAIAEESAKQLADALAAKGYRLSGPPIVTAGAAKCGQKLRVFTLDGEEIDAPEKVAAPYWSDIPADEETKAKLCGMHGAKWYRDGLHISASDTSIAPNNGVLLLAVEGEKMTTGRKASELAKGMTVAILTVGIVRDAGNIKEWGSFHLYVLDRSTGGLTWWEYGKADTTFDPQKIGAAVHDAAAKLPELKR